MRPDQTPPPPSIPYLAENDADCAFCDDPITKGDEVRCYEDVDGLVHVRCDDEEIMRVDVLRCGLFEVPGK